MRGSLTLGHVRGIPIRAHFTLLIILPYLAFLMATRFMLVAREAGVEGTDMVLPPVVWGLILAVLLFACVLLHELGHALVALRSGGSVSSVTLMLLGGVSELHGLPKTPRAEGLVAVAGPVVSLLLGGIALGLHAVIAKPVDVRFGLYYLGQINIVLAIFNILPAFPMDGGRVLRALLSIKWSRETATRIAAGAGSVFAAAFVILGLVAGNFILMLIGVFVWFGAQAESRTVSREGELRNLTVRDVMLRVDESLEPWDSIEQAAEMMGRLHTTALPVVDQSHVIGVVAAHHLESVPERQRVLTPVSAVTARNVPRLTTDEPLITALERMAEQNTMEAPVLELGRPVGVLDASDLNRALRFHRLMAHPDRRRTPIIDEQPGATDSTA